MKGYWHVAALAVAMSALTRILDHYLCLILFFTWLFYLVYTERLRKQPFIVSLICFLCFMLYLPPLEIASDLTAMPPKNQPIHGEIVTPVSLNPNKMEFTFRESQSNKQILILYFPNKQNKNNHYNAFKHGASCRIKGAVELPAASRNPGQFDYQMFLATKGIGYQVVVDSLDHIECTGGSLLSHVYQSRVNLLVFLQETLSMETSAWVAALVLGDDSYLSSDTIDLFRRWSLAHILAISGLHIGLIVTLAYFILIKLSLVTKETAHWLMMIFLPLYALIAGGQPSVWRAVMMVVLVIIFNKTKLKYSAFDTLSIVFMLLIICNPYIIYQIGFQLSFIVTMGLVLSGPLLSQTTSPLLKGLLISFISQMVILPVQINYFSTFQPLSIFLNVLVVPYFSFFVIPLMFLLVLISPVSIALINMLDTVFMLVHQPFLSMMAWLDRIVFSPLIIGDLSFTFILVYYVLFFIFMKQLQIQKNRGIIQSGIALTSLVIVFTLKPYLSPYGTVTMLDIGQGDAFVIELPYRRGVFLIDAGSGFSFEKKEATKTTYQQIIRPYLYSKGISKIDAIFLSHEHSDHIGSVSYLLADMAVGEIIISHFYDLSPTYAKAWGVSGVPIRRVGVNQLLTLKGQSFQVLGPTKDIDANENSLLLYTKLGNLNWLFTGDMYVRTERELIKRYATLAIDVLKVAHHGSNTSTAEQFVSQVQPTYALIPVGVKNRYGHPSKEVTDRLTEHSVTIMRTDEDGAIHYRYKEAQVGMFYKYLP